MARSLCLARSGVPAINTYRTGGARLQIEVSSAEELDRNIFLFRRALHGNDARDTFVCVCSPVDLEVWPADEPDEAEGFFRLDQVTLDIPTKAQTQELWELIQAEACELVAALDRWDVLRDGLEYLSEDGSRTILMTMTGPQAARVARMNGFQVRFSIDAATGIDTELFLHRQQTLNPYSGDQPDRFMTVCSPVHLADWPTESPREDYPRPFFRRAYADFFLPSTAEIDATWELFKEKIDELRIALGKLDGLEELSEVCCDSSDNSDSSS